MTRAVGEGESRFLVDQRLFDSELQRFYPPLLQHPTLNVQLPGQGTTASTMAMSKYENMLWEEKMKEKIKCTCFAAAGISRFCH